MKDGVESDGVPASLRSWMFRNWGGVGHLTFLVELALPTGSPSFIATLSLFGFLAFMMQNRHRSIDQKCRLIFIILA